MFFNTNPIPISLNTSILRFHICVKLLFNHALEGCLYYVGGLEFFSSVEYGIVYWFCSPLSDSQNSESSSSRVQGQLSGNLAANKKIEVGRTKVVL